MNSQECKVRREIANVNGDDPVFNFIFLVLKQVKVVVVVTILIVHIQNCVFLML